MAFLRDGFFPKNVSIHSHRRSWAEWGQNDLH